MPNTSRKIANRIITNVKPFDKPIYIARPIMPDLKELNEKLKEVWASGWLTNNGPQHAALEEALRLKLNVPYLSLFNNGTIALMVACKSLGLSGDVITTPFTFAATPHVLTWNNINIQFCDIDPVTMNIDANKIQSMITPKTTAILAVHVYGNPCDVETIQNIADKQGLRVIYDAAHAFGVKLNDQSIGNFGDISMFSFHATKLFHTVEGGALVFSDASLKKKIDLLKNFGIKNEEEVVMPGINGKMNEIQSIIGLLNLDLVSGEIEKRQLLTECYENHLADVEGIIFFERLQDVESNYQYFVIRIDSNAFGVSRDLVYDKLKEYNIFARKYFYPLCSNYPCYQHLPSASVSNLPVANKVAKEVLCLPLYGTLSPDDVERICIALKSLRK